MYDAHDEGGFSVDGARQRRDTRTTQEYVSGFRKARSVRGYRAHRAFSLVRSGEPCARTSGRTGTVPAGVGPVSGAGSGAAVAPDAAARLGPAVLAVESSLQRLVLVVLPPWLAVLTLEGLAAVPVWPVQVVLAAAGTVLVGYGVFLRAGPRRRPIQLLGPLIGSAGVLVVLNPAAMGRGASPLVLNWLAMTCFCIGALLKGPAIAWTCGAVVGGWLAVALGRDLGLGSSITPVVYLSVAVLALVDGLVVAAAAGVARQTAAGVDQGAADQALLAATAARSEAADREMRHLTRVMHDTAVNTLGAVHRWPQHDRAALARRCAADLAILTRAQHREIRDPADLVASVVSRAELLGVDLQVQAAGWGPPLDPEVAAALEGAGWEALNNVVKHSGQQQARLEWSWDGRDGVLVVADPGRGFSRDGQPSAGGGLDAVTRRATEAGVAVRVQSGAGDGTCVELRWSDARTGATEPVQGSGAAGGSMDAQLGTLESVLARAGWRIAAILGVVGVISTVFQPSGPPRWGSVAAVGIVAAVAGYCRGIARGAVLPAVPGALYAVAVLLVSLLPGIGATGCARTGDWWWGPMAGLAVLCAAVLVDRRTSVILAAVAAYVAGTVLVIVAIGAPGSVCAQDSWAILVFNLAIVVALVLFRRQLEVLWDLGQQINESLRHDAVAQARAEEATRIRREHIAIAQRVAGPILKALATGQADPLDPPTRDDAGRAEGALRALAAIPSALPPDQAEALAGLVLGAHDRGVALHLSLPNHLAPGNSLDPDPASPVLGGFVGACPAGSAAQLTYLHLGTSTQILGWAELTGFDLAALHRAIDRDPAPWVLDTGDGQVLLESTPPPEDDDRDGVGSASPPQPMARAAVLARPRGVARFTNLTTNAEG